MQDNIGRESSKDNDLFFTCSLIDYIARKTKNTRMDVVNTLGKKRIEKIYDLADVYHSDNIDRVSDDFIVESGMADYKTNLNYKSSGWFFLCNLYKNGKTRKRCKRMNDSAFLNSRRTGIFKDMSNGTICIPKDLRDNNGLEKNDRVELIPMQEGIYIRKAYGEKKCQ